MPARGAPLISTYVRHRITCAVLALLAAAAGDAGAAEWFVAPGGTGGGTSAAPYGRIQDALQVAQPGDTITVRSGTYSGAIQTIRHGTSAAPIKLRAAGERGGVTLTASGRVLSVNHANFIAEGLVLDGKYGADDTVRVAS